MPKITRRHNSEQNSVNRSTPYPVNPIQVEQNLVESTQNQGKPDASLLALSLMQQSDQPPSDAVAGSSLLMSDMQQGIHELSSQPALPSWIDKSHPSNQDATMILQYQYIAPEGHEISLESKRIVDQILEGILNDEIEQVKEALSDRHFSKEIFLIGLQRFKGIELSLLEQAVYRERFEILYLLLCSSYCTEDVLSHQMNKRYDTTTLLSYAIEIKQAKACELIMNAPCFRAHHYLETQPLLRLEFDCPVSDKTFHIMNTLLSYKNAGAVKQALEMKNKQGMTPLISVLAALGDVASRVYQEDNNQFEYCLKLFYKMCNLSERPENFLTAQDDSQISVLNYAVDTDLLEVMEALLKLDEFNESLLYISDDQNKNIFFHAMHSELIGKRLLSLPSIDSRVFFEVSSNNGYTLLHQAVSLTQEELVKLYLTPGAIKNFPEAAIYVPDREGKSILHKAIEKQSLTIVELLLSSPYKDQLLLQQDANGRSPIAYLEYLLTNGIGFYSKASLEQEYSAIKKLEQNQEKAQLEMNLLLEKNPEYQNEPIYKSYEAEVIATKRVLERRKKTAERREQSRERALRVMDQMYTMLLKSSNSIQE